MSYDFLYEVAGGVATITLNRPEVMNALTFEVYAQLRELFESLRTDATVRAVIMTGAGDNFCSGGDVHKIIGELFKSRSANFTNTELIVLVTPTIVDPVQDIMGPPPVQVSYPMQKLDTDQFDKNLPYAPKSSEAAK